jgi:hypothetical protein
MVTSKVTIHLLKVGRPGDGDRSVRDKLLGLTVAS